MTLSAFLAFVAPLAGLAGVLIGARLQGRQWLRTQRQEAYAEFMVAVQEFERAADALWDEVQTEWAPHRGVLAGEVREAKRHLDIADQRLQLIGTPAMCDVASEFVMTASEAAEPCKELLDDRLAFAKAWDTEGLDGIHDGARFAFVMLAQTFKTTARRELRSDSQMAVLTAKLKGTARRARTSPPKVHR